MLVITAGQSVKSDIRRGLVNIKDGLFNIVDRIFFMILWVVGERQSQVLVCGVVTLKLHRGQQAVFCVQH